MVDVEALLLSSVWLSIGLWIPLYAADYYMTIWGAKLHARGAKEHMVYEGSYELTPQFQKDIDAHRVFSPRFLKALTLSVVLLTGLWYAADLRHECKAMFLVAYGGLAFRQLAILVRHARTIVLFRHMVKHQGVEGCIRYARWLNLELSSADLVSTALLLLGAAVVGGKLTLYGGAFALLVVAVEHRKMSRKSKTETVVKS